MAKNHLSRLKKLENLDAKTSSVPEIVIRMNGQDGRPTRIDHITCASKPPWETKTRTITDPLEIQRFLEERRNPNDDR